MIKSAFKLIKKWLIRIIVFVFACAVILPLIGIGLLWHSEYRRAELIKQYSVPPPFFKEMLSKKTGEMRELMEANETLVCGINGYASAADIPELNAKQKASIPKSNLPSEDLAWYLLFFTDERISRVYLIGKETLEGNIDYCIGPGGKFEVAIDGGTHVLSFIKKEQ